METNTVELAQIMDRLESLHQEVSRLSERVAALERPATPSQATPQETISEDVILIISAAIAAFLGKKPHIRQIRLLSSASWAQQGRATIQASHAIPVQHGQ